MPHLIITAAALVATISLGACLVEAEDTMELGESAAETTIENGLPWNGLPWNGLPWNGLPWNGLPWNGLPWNGLPWNGLPSSEINQQFDNWLNDPTNSDLNDTFMRYLVICALDSGDSASFTDSTGVVWEWYGELGLAPNWTNAGLSLSEQRWITACVLSLVNEIGVSVQISQRGPDTSLFKLKVREVKKWDVLEAAFFGNMFADTPVYYACLAESTYVDQGVGRTCALTDENDDNRCGIIEALGTCDDICDSEILTVRNKSYKVFKNCEGADDVTYGQEVITVALRD